MSQSIPSQPRLPSYEGHLILNHAILSDTPQTSSGEAWSEKWCSLEEGKLLVYKDRTSAMINPQDTCASIDIRNFAHVYTSTTTTSAAEPAHELVLGTTTPEPARSSRLFRPKSALSLNRLHADSISESEPRISIASSGRVSFQALASILNGTTALSAKTDGEGRSKPWARFASGSRKLYSKVSLSSNGSVYDGSPVTLGSAASSIKSIGDSRESTDLASSGAPSPRTPHSSSFSGSFERVVLRASSADTLNEWHEALTRTIKVHNHAMLMPLPMMRYQKRVSPRPSLGNLPGFRTPTSLQNSPMFPTVESGDVSYTDDATPKATRKRQSSSTSFTFGRYTALQELCREPQGQQVDGQKVSYPGSTSGSREHIVIHEPPKRANAAPALSSFASHVFSAVDTKRQERRHKRSISTASSSLSFSGAGRLSTNRRNSISSSQLLSSPAQVRASSNEASRLQKQPELRSSTPLNEDADVSRATIGGTLPMSKHRRSGSILRFGSARILAWRDNFTASEPVRQEPAVGLGLDLEQSSIGDTSRVKESQMSAQLKPSKAFPRLRSFRLLTKARPFDGEVSFASPSEEGHHEEASFSQPTAKSKGMSRTSSLLNLTKHTFSSFRERSTSRQNARQIFTATQEDVQDLSTESVKRVETPGCDFSYELVSPTREASPQLPSLLDAGDCNVGEIQRVGEETSLVLSPPRSASLSLAAPMKINLLNNGDEDYGRCSTPPLPVERILPPEQIISTFDQLRLADPEGRSCDWLSQIETSRGSLDWASATMGQQRGEPGRGLRLAASQQFKTGSVDLGKEGERRLRSSVSACYLSQAQARAERERGERGEKREGLMEESIGRAGTPVRVSEDTTLDMARSLPAPPRASKRRARISTSMPKSPLGVSSLLPAIEIAVPLGDSTNTQSFARRDGVEKMARNDTIVTKTPPPRSPSRRLGPRRKMSPATSSPTAKGGGYRVAPLA